MAVRLMATFRPQAWVNDNAVDLKGKKTFDATKAFLSLTNDKIRGFKENDYDSDSLADNLPERQAHDGPFEVDVDIDDWLETNGFDCTHEELTDEQIETLRQTFAHLFEEKPEPEYEQFTRWVVIKAVIRAPKGSEQNDIADQVFSDCNYELSYDEGDIKIVDTELTAQLDYNPE